MNKNSIVLGCLMGLVRLSAYGADLVLVNTVIPDCVLDIRYATTNNFTGKSVYTSDACYLLEPALTALKKAADEFRSLGYRIVIWDAYRPRRVQYILWEIVPDPRYVANPAKGSKHNRGCAVDITLIDKNGVELDMGTEFDDFTVRAHRDCVGLSQQVIRNRTVLESVMKKHHFVGEPTEWWHFDFEEWKRYPLLDVDISDIG